MDGRDRTTGTRGGGDAVAKALSVAVILVAAAGAIAGLPERAPAGAPPGTRELIGLVGVGTDHAAWVLSKHRVHRSHNAEGEFYYASPDGCHAHMRIRLVSLAGFVVAYARENDSDRRCMAAEPAAP